MADNTAALNAADRMREFMESSDRGMARVPVAHLSEWRQMLSDRYQAEVERVNRATDAEIGGIHRSFASPSPPPSAGVDAVAMAIVGPYLPVPAGSKWSLDELRKVRWDGLSEAERQQARNSAKAVLALTPAPTPVEAGVFESDKTRAAVDPARAMLAKGINIQAVGEVTNAVVQGALQACISHIDELEADFAALRAAVALAKPAPRESDLADYDAGLLNDWGGGNVEWWQDYLRAEIGRANDFWRSQIPSAMTQEVAQ